MNNALKELKHALYSVVDNDKIKCNEIDKILSSRIEVYNQMTCISKKMFENFSKNRLEEIRNYQNKSVAYEFGKILVTRNNIKIEHCDPEDYRDILSGELPNWAHFEERRLAKLWVLK